MLKRKPIIYAVIFFVFTILIFLYGRNVYISNEKDTLSRIQSAVVVSESSIRKNFEYQSKSILLDCFSLNLSQAASATQAAKLLRDNGMAANGYYIVDSNGYIVMPDAALDGKRIDSAALELSRTNGYSATGLSDLNLNTHFVILLSPLSNAWNGYVARAYEGNEFVGLITEGITLSSSTICLFDEWSNVVGSVVSDTAANASSLVSSIQGGAEAFGKGGPANAYRPIHGGKAYNVYFKIDTPASWFFGAQISWMSSSDSYFLSLPLSSIFMFAVLIFLLVVVLSLDALNERETKKKITHVSNIDPLTGLLNSAGMRASMLSVLEKSQPRAYSLICADIVAFSRINTMFGHSVGDCLLQAVAQVIKERYHCGTRTNADCFVFLSLDGDKDCSEIERRFTDAIELQMGSQYLQMVTFKFGINIIDKYPINFQEIYDGALLAMKSAKKNATKNDIFFDAELKESMETLRNIEVNMMHALSREEFLIYVQPQITLPEETCLRGETLIRWNSEFMGFLPPDKFIPIFESNGFIVETDFYMLTAAMQLVQERAVNGLSPVILAVNQSKVTITFPNYYERLKLLIAEFPNAPLDHVELEITESALETEWDKIVPLIHSVKKLGFSIAMDDFGSGYSSLNTLRILPIDILKIDREFLKECENSQRCRVIIKNVINLAKELDIKIICEGVENEAQLAFLKEHNCDIAQGFFYSKPVPIQMFLEKYFPTA